MRLPAGACARAGWLAVAPSPSAAMPPASRFRRLTVPPPAAGAASLSQHKQPASGRERANIEPVMVLPSLSSPLSGASSRKVTRFRQGSQAHDGGRVALDFWVNGGGRNVEVGESALVIATVGRFPSQRARLSSRAAARKDRDQRHQAPWH